MNDQFDPLNTPPAEPETQSEPPRSRIRALSIISMVAGILSLWGGFSPYGIMFGLSAVIVSVFDRNQSGLNTQNKLGLIFGIIGFCVSALCVVVIALSGDIVSQALRTLIDMMNEASGS